jgi:hypothetical protein
MNAQDAQLLTMETGMKLNYVCPGYEYWIEDILYSFIPAPQLDTMIDEIMRDTAVLGIWIDSTGNGVVSTKCEHRR